MPSRHSRAMPALLMVLLIVALPPSLLASHSRVLVALALPAAVSLAATLAVAMLWVTLPNVRSGFFGQVTCQCLALTAFSASWLVALLIGEGEARCSAFKLSAAAWLGSFLWSLPLALDWLMLMSGAQRSSGGARRFLSRACHLTWLVAALMGLPVVRSKSEPLNGTAVPSDPSPFAPFDAAARALPRCALHTPSPSWYLALSQTIRPNAPDPTHPTQRPTQRPHLTA